MSDVFFFGHVYELVELVETQKISAETAIKRLRELVDQELSGVQDCARVAGE